MGGLWLCVGVPLGLSEDPGALLRRHDPRDATFSRAPGQGPSGRTRGHNTIASALSGGRLVASWRWKCYFRGGSPRGGSFGWWRSHILRARLRWPVEQGGHHIGPSHDRQRRSRRFRRGRYGHCCTCHQLRHSHPAPLPPSTAGPATAPAPLAPAPATPPPTPGATGSSSAAPVVPASIAVSELQACLPGAGLRTYQGDLVAQPDGQTDNVLPLEDYVDGVVPAESPPSWWAQEARRRSRRRRLQPAAWRWPSSPRRAQSATRPSARCTRELPDQYGMTAESAVTSTAGQVLYCGASSTCGPAGSIAVAEYSSSTGGYTAGGAFPPVPDLGDSVAPTRCTRGR